MNKFKVGQAVKLRPENNFFSPFFAIYPETIYIVKRTKFDKIELEEVPGNMYNERYFVSCTEENNVRKLRKSLGLNE